MGNHAGDQDIGTTIKILDDEVLELKQQESDLLARLHLLQDTIARKEAQAGKLKNSLVPVYRLPNEILLACFHQAVQSCLSESDIERTVAHQFGDGIKLEDFWPCKPAFTVSHVSHNFRQLAINMPSLWTHLVVAPKFGHHMDVFQEFLRRVKNMPCAATFRSFGVKGSLSPSELLVIEAIMPLLQAQQIIALSFLDSALVFSCLRSRVVKQPITSPPSLNVLSGLTALTVFEFAGRIKFTDLRLLLSATPQLKSLGFHTKKLINDGQEDRTPINLPMLDSITIIACPVGMHDFLRLLSVPDLRQFKLLSWDIRDYPSYFFINDLPRFPNVQTLVFSSDYGYCDLEIMRAFPRITHLTLWNCGIFLDNHPPSVYWSNLRHLTLDFAFEDAIQPSSRATWLETREGRAEYPLQISVLDSSKEINKYTNRKLFRYYKELQPFGNLEGSRLNEFRQWQADGEPKLT